MLPNVASLIPAGAGLAVAVYIATHSFPPSFSVDLGHGRCLGASGGPEPCSAAADLFIGLASGKVHMRSSNRCLGDGGDLPPCSAVGRHDWDVDGAQLLRDGKPWAPEGTVLGFIPRRRRIEVGPPPAAAGEPASLRGLVEAGTVGAAVALGIGVLYLFYLDVFPPANKVRAGRRRGTGVCGPPRVRARTVATVEGPLPPSAGSVLVLITSRVSLA